MTSNVDKICLPESKINASSACLTPIRYGRQLSTEEGYPPRSRLSNHESKTHAVWASLITNFEYIPGLLCLEYSLRQTQSQYPFVALYTDSFPEAGHEVLAHRGITAVRVDYLTPPTQKDFSVDARFTETWTKLTVFGLTAYDRLVLLDGDMIVRRNIDELMELPLDSPAAQGRGSRVFAASHACACNPLKKPSYPPTWCVTA